MAVRYPAYSKRQLFGHTGLFRKMPRADPAATQAEGLSVTKIAQRLSMKSETVKYHISENYRKLGVSGKADAMLTARSLNLL
ncbi:MAG: helix-turn-helix transcriptional regulator [Clostridia bacterium]